MDGLTYLFGQLIWWLLPAFLLWIFAAWFAGLFFESKSNDEKELEKKWKEEKIEKGTYSGWWDTIGLILLIVFFSWIFFT